jgi:hypothetical protein
MSSGSDSDPTGKLAAEIVRQAEKNAKRSSGETTHVCIQDSAIRAIMAELQDIKNTGLKEIKNEVSEINQRLAAGATKMALLDERSENVGRIIWGIGAVVGLGLLTLLGSAVVWVITKAGGHP